jgi:hypothetical protein
MSGYIFNGGVFYSIRSIFPISLEHVMVRTVTYGPS